MPQDVQATAEEQQAYQLLFDQIHAPVFLEKLAEFGVEPQSEAEMEALLQMGASLMRSQAVERQKAAAAQGSYILKAADSLNTALAERGLASPQPAAVDQLIKDASYRLAQNPAVQQAALKYQDYLARQRQAG